MRARRERDDAAGAPAAHGRWLAANGWAALWGGAAVEVCELYESGDPHPNGSPADINAMIAWAWAQRGDRARAVQFAQRSLVSERSTPRTVLSAALAAWEVGNAATRPGHGGDGRLLPG